MVDSSWCVGQSLVIFVSVGQLVCCSIDVVVGGLVMITILVGQFGWWVIQLSGVGSWKNIFSDPQKCPQLHYSNVKGWGSSIKRTCVNFPHYKKILSENILIRTSDWWSIK